MLERIAVHFGRRSVQQRRARHSREVERVARADRSDVERLERQPRVVDGRSRRGEIEDGLRRADHRNRLADVVLHEGVARVAAISLGVELLAGH